jgi:hypothetical protein
MLGDLLHIQLGSLGLWTVHPRISKLFEELFEFIAATMQITDDVKGAFLGLSIVPQGSPYNLSSLDLLLILEFYAGTKALETNAA